jgi:hypothetical protein
MRTLATALVMLLGCSSVDGESQFGEEGMLADEVGVEVDGVLVRCGNFDEENAYWQFDDQGPHRIRLMPVVCMGPATTPGFDLADAVPFDGGHHFPDWDEAIAERCEMACLEAHDPETGEMPVCELENFTPNIVWDKNWTPGEGAQCDSTVLALVVDTDLDVVHTSKGDEP